MILQRRKYPPQITRHLRFSAQVIPFKRQVYEAVVAEFAPLIGVCLKDGRWATEHARL